MSTPGAKSGALTINDLRALWVGSVDPGYSSPMLLKGDGEGIEAINQGLAQLARVSEAVDQTTQALFIRGWSGQTGTPALGGVRATVTLTLTRSKNIHHSLLVPKGLRVQEIIPDSSTDGIERFETGRIYELAADVFFLPGETGPFDVQAVAEKEGYGYNNPQPSTIAGIVQPGAGLNNTGGVGTIDYGVTSGQFRYTFALTAEPDVLTPDQVGQYLAFTNSIYYAPIEAYISSATTTSGGSVLLSAIYVCEGSMAAGTFITGESAELRNGLGVVIGTAQILGQRSVLGVPQLGLKITRILNLSSSIATIVGAQSAAVFTFTGFSEYASPPGTKAWSVLSWADDLGLVATNADQPSGGRSAALDALAWERNINRAPGESDASLALRTWQVADIISPNSVRRAANRVLSTYGLSCILREVGSALFPGMYCDAGASTDAVPLAEHDFAYDVDIALRPDDRWKCLLDSVEMRAFFLIQVPDLQWGGWGLFFDGSNADVYPTLNAFDASDLQTANFFDGAAEGQAAVYRAVYDAVSAVKAGGVGFDLVR